MVIQRFSLGCSEKKRLTTDDRQLTAGVKIQQR